MEPPALTGLVVKKKINQKTNLYIYYIHTHTHTHTSYIYMNKMKI